MEGAPWKKWNKGEGLDSNALARLLKKFHIRSWKKRWRSGDEPRAGYRKADIVDAAERYVPPMPADSEEDEEPLAALPPEHPERRNKPSPTAEPAVPTPPGTVPGTATETGSDSVSENSGPAAPFRPPFRPHPERLDPHDCASRSAVPGVPSTPADDAEAVA
ncbi:MAG: DUF3631 domain-containing protein [Holophagales bacterium]|nr:DUF3631 domain-containing protein [Holophagales bacterium]